MTLTAGNLLCRWILEIQQSKKLPPIQTKLNKKNWYLLLTKEKKDLPLSKLKQFCYDRKNIEWAAGKRKNGEDFILWKICQKFHFRMSECYSTNWQIGKGNETQKKRLFISKTPLVITMKPAIAVDLMKAKQDIYHYNKMIQQAQEQNDNRAAIDNIQLLEEPKKDIKWVVNIKGIQFNKDSSVVRPKFIFYLRKFVKENLSSIIAVPSNPEQKIYYNKVIKVV